MEPGGRTSQTIPANNACVQKSRGLYVLSVDWFVKFVTNQQRVQMFTPPY